MILTAFAVVVARGRAVVEDDAVLAQHQTVARAADRQRLKAVDVDAVEKLAGIGSLDVDLAERGDVDHSDLVARRQRLADDRLAHALAGLRIGARAQP